MKLPIIMTSAIVLGFVSQGAVAACSQPAATQVSNNTTPSLATLLSGNTVCATRGGDRWQEEHHGTGAAGSELWDYKLGDGDPVDPRKQVGTWVVSGTGANTVITYDYGGGTQYIYKVWDNGGGVYSF